MPLGVHFGSLLAPPGAPRAAFGVLLERLGAPVGLQGCSWDSLGGPSAALGVLWGCAGVYFVDFERAEPRKNELVGVGVGVGVGVCKSGEQIVKRYNQYTGTNCAGKAHICEKQ